MKREAFQDLGPVRSCFGCGADNQKGLQIKSYWDRDEAVCLWQPRPYHCGGSKAFVYGGILASIMDCHSVNLAVARAYKREGRTIGSMPQIFFVTAKLEISFVLPTPMGVPLELRAKLTKVEGRKSWVSCVLTAAGRIRAKAEVLAIRVQREEE